ncbi:MAG: hypothetical protein ACD_59C00125G0003 [uncultured bacterium]|nr:MAG: hypothetical protein ACD_59C00125G0003 [uncultured bacterium]
MRKNGRHDDAAYDRVFGADSGSHGGFRRISLNAGAENIAVVGYVYLDGFADFEGGGTDIAFYVYFFRTALGHDQRTLRHDRKFFSGRIIAGFSRYSAAADGFTVYNGIVLVHYRKRGARERGRTLEHEFHSIDADVFGASSRELQDRESFIRIAYFERLFCRRIGRARRKKLAVAYREFSAGDWRSDTEHVDVLRRITARTADIDLVDLHAQVARIGGALLDISHYAQRFSGRGPFGYFHKASR